jgi:hypothetical protein
MACDGETIAIDMLFAPDEMIIETSDIWDEIRKHRHRLLTKNMKAFLGYCKRQAAKYGVRGSRLKAIDAVIGFLDSSLNNPADKEIKLNTLHKEAISYLVSRSPEHIKVLNGFEKGGKFINKKVLQVCESKYDFTCSTRHIVDSLKKKYDAYGHRAQQTKNNEGIDWKAISHALRAGYQLKEIYETGNLVYPLRKADFLLKVKKGELDYTTEVAPALDMLIDEVELLASRSNFPESVDRSFWYNFIQDVYDVELDKEY